MRDVLTEEYINNLVGYDRRMLRNMMIELRRDCADEVLTSEERLAIESVINEMLGEDESVTIEEMIEYVGRKNYVYTMISLDLEKKVQDIIDLP